MMVSMFFFFSSRRRHTRYIGDWSSDVCSSDLTRPANPEELLRQARAGDTAALGRLLETYRSEERRVGKECRSRWSQNREKKKEKKTVSARGGGNKSRKTVNRRTVTDKRVGEKK